MVVHPHAGKVSSAIGKASGEPLQDCCRRSSEPCNYRPRARSAVTDRQRRAFVDGTWSAAALKCGTQTFPKWRRGHRRPCSSLGEARISPRTPQMLP